MFPGFDCSMFMNEMSQRATTVSLSILVIVEMFNAMNSLSENESLFTFFLHNNVYLCFAIVLSVALHFMILYVPFFSSLFSILPLNWEEWKWVLIISAPVLLIDEILKFISRNYVLKQSNTFMAKKQQVESSSSKNGDATVAAGGKRKSTRKTKKA